MPDRLTRIERRAAAATEAPWIFRKERGVVESTSGYVCEANYSQSIAQDDGDNNLIAHARQDIPDLCELVRRADLLSPKSDGLCRWCGYSVCDENHCMAHQYRVARRKFDKGGDA